MENFINKLEVDLIECDADARMAATSTRLLHNIKHLSVFHICAPIIQQVMIMNDGCVGCVRNGLN